MVSLIQYIFPFTTDDQTTGDCIPGADLSPCTSIEEIKFFAGMVPMAKLPLRAIHQALESVSSRRVEVITLDLTTTDPMDAPSQEFLQIFQRLDFNLHWIALAHQGDRRTVVKLSANDPFVLGSCLRRFTSYGKLVLGTRSGGPSGFGDVQWLNGR